VNFTGELLKQHWRDKIDENDLAVEKGCTRRYFRKKERMKFLKFVMLWKIRQQEPTLWIQFP
jgi:hypothetical protein